jgi:hypothetical protein
VLSILELLVVKRAIRTVYFTRLPTGHTHEDIDACFGVIWKTWYRNRPCGTLDEYANGIEKAFADTKLKAKVYTVMIVPDYVKYLDPCIDPYLGQMHKTERTQHQWRFEAVEISPLFPRGAKTTFRAYSADQVVEIKMKNPEQCASPIGQHTGLEPVLVQVCWYPSKQCHRERNCEGYYILKDVPNVPRSVIMDPMRFPEDGVRASFEKTLREIEIKFPLTQSSNSAVIQDHAELRKSWKMWNDTWFPSSDDANEFVNELTLRGKNYHMPLKQMLFDNTSQKLSASRWKTHPIQNGLNVINPNFEW